MIYITINSDSIIEVQLESSATGQAMSLNDLHDLIITFFVIGTNKKVVRFRKTPNVLLNDEPITETDGKILLKWKRAFTTNMVPSKLRVQHTEMYEDANFEGGIRKTTIHYEDAAQLVPNENVDAL